MEIEQKGVIFHPLLLPALLYKAEDDLDGVQRLFDDGRVQHIVPLAANRLQQKLACIASSPVKCNN